MLLTVNDGKMASLLAPMSELSKLPPHFIITFCVLSFIFSSEDDRGSHCIVEQIVLGVLKCSLNSVQKWEDISMKVGSMPWN